MNLIQDDQLFYFNPLVQQKLNNYRTEIVLQLDSILAWIDRFKTIKHSFKVYQMNTLHLIQKFPKVDLSEPDQLLNGIGNGTKESKPIFEEPNKWFDLYESEVLDRLAMILTQLIKEVNERNRELDDAQMAYDRAILGFSGLKKLTMSPQRAMRLVEECHQLYQLRERLAQAVLDVTQYLDHLIKISPNLTQAIDHAINQKQIQSYPIKIDDLGFKLKDRKLASNKFKAELAEYKTRLGLNEGGDDESVPISRGSPSLGSSMTQGFMLFNVGPMALNSLAGGGDQTWGSPGDEVWYRGYFTLDDHGVLKHLARPNQPQIPEVDLQRCELMELNHPNRHHIVELRDTDPNRDHDRAHILLQFETGVDKTNWTRSLWYHVGVNFNNDDDLRSDGRSAHSLPIHIDLGSEASTSRDVSRAASLKGQSMTRPNSTAIGSYANLDGTRSVDQISTRSRSELDGSGQQTIIKVGQIQVRDVDHGSIPIGTSLPPSSQGSWKKIMATLDCNGSLSLYSEDKRLVIKIDIPEVLRVSIRALDDSYYQAASCFMVVDEAGLQHSFQASTRTERNVWLCLLKAFAMPEILGQRVPIPKIYRVSRSLWLRVIEGRNLDPQMPMHCQVYLDRQLAALTSVKAKMTQPFWREDFLADELAKFQIGVTIHLVISPKPGKYEVSGQTLIPVKSLRPGEFYEGWYPIISEASPILSPSASSDKSKKKSKLQLPFQRSNKGAREHELSLPTVQHHCGDLRLKLRYDEVVVLKSGEYIRLAKLVSEFENDLVEDLVLAAKHLDWVSETFLKILCTQELTVNWFSYLAGREIDLTEDLNLLFRGNSILTKSIDAYMKMVGLQYVDDTIGAIIRELCTHNVSCEVDPHKTTPADDVKHNWKVLIRYATQLWHAIRKSNSQCPKELRFFFSNLRRILAEKLTSVPSEQMLLTRYTCVSGFLFLRLFCPAVLSPKLFGLVKEHPNVKVHRTLTLLAKTLQCLANLSDFGDKEPYMLQMNTFISDHMNEFMDFIDYIASSPAIDPQPSQRHPSIDNRSGFNSITAPYRIDLDRELSLLVNFVMSYSKPLKLKLNPNNNSSNSNGYGGSEKGEDNATKLSKGTALQELVSLAHQVQFTVDDVCRTGH